MSIHIHVWSNTPRHIVILISWIITTSICWTYVDKTPIILTSSTAPNQQHAPQRSWQQFAEKEMIKYNFTEQQQHPNNSSSFLFVHIGKTAGSTVRMTLANNCLTFANKHRARKCKSFFTNQVPTTEQTILSKRTIAFTHVNYLRPPQIDMNNIDYYIVPLRSPIDRFVSAFYMHTPRNGEGCNNTYAKDINGEESDAFFCNCYAYVGDLMNDLNNTTEGVAYYQSPIVHLEKNRITTTCNEIGNKVFSNNPPSWTGHMATYNYNFYNNWMANQQNKELHTKKQIIVIRKEHLWDDLQNLEYILGGNATINSNIYKSTTHGSDKYKYNMPLTRNEMQLLCCHIIDEMELYVGYLLRAYNVGAEQRRESLRALDQQCNRDICLQKERG